MTNIYIHSCIIVIYIYICIYIFVPRCKSVYQMRGHNRSPMKPYSVSVYKVEGTTDKYDLSVIIIP